MNSYDSGREARCIDDQGVGFRLSEPSPGYDPDNGFSLIAFSMLLDTIDHDRRISGLNREGVYSGIWSAMDKTAFAFGALMAGIALQFVGFQESAEGFVAQTPEAVRGIGIVFACAPAFFAAIAMAVMTRYRLES